MDGMRWWLLAPLVLAACYPDFRFGGEGGNGGGTGGTPTEGGNPSTSRTIATTDDTTVSTGGAEPQGGETTVSMGGTSEGGSPGVTTTTTTTSGPDENRVPCGNGMSVVEDCAIAESCCFSLEDPADDHCQSTFDCGDSYYTFNCNDPGDCSTEFCCALIEEDFFGDEVFTGYIECKSSCAGINRRMCASQADCESGELCEQIFADSFAPEYADTYKNCVPQ
jgi:hypothetical protein